MKALDPKITNTVNGIAEVVGDLPIEQQCRAIGAAAMMLGDYDAAIQFATMAKDAAAAEPTPPEGGDSDG